MIIRKGRPGPGGRCTPRRVDRWGGRALRLAAAAAGLGLAGLAYAGAQGWEIEAETVRIGSFSAGPVDVRIDGTGDGGGTLRLRIGQVTLPWPLHPVPVITLVCPGPGGSLEVQAGGFQCTHGRISVAGTSLPAEAGAAGRVRMEWSVQGGALRVDALRWLGGTARIVLRYRASATGAARTSFALSLQDGRASEILSAQSPVQLSQGRFTLEARLDGSTGAGSVRLRAEGLGLAGYDGLLAAEDIGLELGLQTRKINGRQHIEATLALTGGVLAWGPVLVDFARHPLRLVLGGAWAGSERRLELDQWSIEQDQIVAVRGQATVSAKPIVRLDRLAFDLRTRSLALLFDTYVRAWVLDTPFAEIEPRGRLSVSGRYADGLATVRAKLGSVRLTDRAQRFSVGGLEGDLSWRSRPYQPGERQAQSELSWERAAVFKVPVGPGRLRGVLEGRRFELSQPARIGIFDGALRLDALRARGLGTAGTAWSLRGALEPMSVEAISDAFGWPRFGGKLAGTVPAVHYRDGVMRVDGALEARVFDGRVTLRNLRLEEPMSVVPRLRTDAEVRGLSLDLLTQAFAFGEILGRIDGEVRALELVDWRPSAFDARFYTPPQDHSRHRISQRAVDNLASLGGGPRSLLSTTFLRFFERFSYRRIGLGCRLQAGVCEMSGVRDEGSSYVIVEGSGVPQITVKGYNREVDWPSLLERLRRASESQGPVIQ